MPIVNGAYVAPNWVNNTSPYINAAEMNAISNTLAQVPVANGGTGATTASAALTNLGAEPKASVTSKGSANTPVYFNSNGVAVAISSPIPVSLGGTGATTAAAAREALGLGSTTGALPIANGGTGATSASAALTSLGAEPKANVTSKGSSSTPVYFDANGVANAMTSPLPVSLGGTGVSQRGSIQVSVSGNLGDMFIWHWGKIVTLRFATNSITTGQTFSGIIPSGYRPTANMYFSSPGANGNHARAMIDNNGNLVIDSLSSSTPDVYRGLITYLI